MLESLGEDDEGAVDEILVARAGVVVRPLSRRRLGARTRGFPAGIRTLLRLGWGIVFIPFGDGGFLQGFNRVVSTGWSSTAGGASTAFGASSVSTAGGGASSSPISRPIKQV